jgi:antitoxin ParD1/3/4
MRACGSLAVGKLPFHPALAMLAIEATPLATMNISLADDRKAFVEGQLAGDGYESTSEYRRELLRKQRDLLKLRAMWVEGFHSGAGAAADEHFFEELPEVAKGKTAP